jgi:hypothetical protein
MVGPRATISVGEGHPRSAIDRPESTTEEDCNLPGRTRSSARTQHDISKKGTELTVEELVRAQQSVLPKEDLTAYEGLWVALRDGLVVASDVDAVALRDNPDVREDDVLTPVPTGEQGLFIL